MTDQPNKPVVGDFKAIITGTSSPAAKILADFLHEHSEGFKKGGTPKDAIRIRKKYIAQIEAREQEAERRGRIMEKAILLKEQTKIRKRYNLLQQGVARTYEEIWDMVAGYESRHEKLTGSEWWNIFEYLDWKYNGSIFTDLEFSRKLETEWHDPE